MKRTLTEKLMFRFSLCMVVILILSAPLFYYILVGYYAEDMIEMSRMTGMSTEQFDLGRDTFVGLIIQIGVILALLGLAVFLVMRFIPARLWQPFNKTLEKIKQFRVEDDNVPVLPETDVREFASLNDTLAKIMTASSDSYKVQKEFTANASHELQTPIAVVQSQLDLLIQDINLTAEQAELAQNMSRELNHMSLLSRNLLLLAKINNGQFGKLDKVCLSAEIKEIVPSLEILADNLNISVQIEDDNVALYCNKVLLVSMVNNLVVNAVRHNKPNGEIHICVKNRSLTVSNSSDEPELDSRHVFNRFYHSSDTQKGNGLGLAIVKSICDYHSWHITYHYEPGEHFFAVTF